MPICGNLTGKEGLNTDNEMKFKSFAISKAKADAAADIDLINQYAMKTLAPEDVFCFSVVLSNNDVDRDMECLSDKSLDELAEMLTGKTGIMDHRNSAEKQVARLYRVEVETPGGMTKLGKTLKQLRGSAYMLRTEENKALIASIEGGITKEVSISFQVKRVACSICDKVLKFDWRNGEQYIGEVVWDSEYACFDIKPLNGRVCPHFGLMNSTEFEVIDNIYDNPELLKAEVKE